MVCRGIGRLLRRARPKSMAERIKRHRISGRRTRLPKKGSEAERPPPPVPGNLTPSSQVGLIPAYFCAAQSAVFQQGGGYHRNA